jgi:hypothetical protein
VALSCHSACKLDPVLIDLRWTNTTDVDCRHDFQFHLAGYSGVAVFAVVPVQRTPRPAGHPERTRTETQTETRQDPLGQPCTGHRPDCPGHSTTGNCSVVQDLGAVGELADRGHQRRPDPVRQRTVPTPTRPTDVRQTRHHRKAGCYRDPASAGAPNPEPTRPCWVCIGSAGAPDPRPSSSRSCESR